LTVLLLLAQFTMQNALLVISNLTWLDSFLIITFLRVWPQLFVETRKAFRTKELSCNAVVTKQTHNELELTFFRQCFWCEGAELRWNIANRKCNIDWWQRTMAVPSPRWRKAFKKKLT
jgi:hypothetical protein